MCKDPCDSLWTRCVLHWLLFCHVVMLRTVSKLYALCVFVNVSYYRLFSMFVNWWFCSAADFIKHLMWPSVCRYITADLLTDYCILNFNCLHKIDAKQIWWSRKANTASFDQIQWNCSQCIFCKYFVAFVVTITRSLLGPFHFAIDFLFF